MSLKICSFDMDVLPGAVPHLPIAGGAAAVFEHLLAVFAPRDLWVQLDGRDVVQLHRTENGGDEVSWLDEDVRPGQVLTRCPSGPAADLVRELRATLTARNPASLYI